MTCAPPFIEEFNWEVHILSLPKESVPSLVKEIKVGYQIGTSEALLLVKSLPLTFVEDKNIWCFPKEKAERIALDLQRRFNACVKLVPRI